PLDGRPREPQRRLEGTRGDPPSVRTRRERELLVLAEFPPRTALGRARPHETGRVRRKQRNDHEDEDPGSHHRASCSARYLLVRVLFYQYSEYTGRTHRSRLRAR